MSRGNRRPGGSRAGANGARAPGRVRAVLGTAIVVLLAACSRDPLPSAPAETIRPVRTVVVAERDLHDALRLPAEVVPRIETRYGFRVAGKLASREVSVGDRVAAGDPLARLDAQDVRPAIDSAQAAFAAARTELALAESELERVAALRGRGFVSEGQLDRQRAAADSARARADQARAALENARNTGRFQLLRAGAAGVVTAVDAEAGQVVAAGQVVVRVAPLDDIELLVAVPQADLGAIDTIEHWEVVLPALPRRRFGARLRELSPAADPATRSYPMRLALTGDTAGIALGMSATVAASRRSERGIVVPLSALVARGEQAGVWVVGEDRTVDRVVVELGDMRDDGVRIASGLAPGARIVVAGANLLEPGQRVRLDEASR